jgi:hypothetical protein
MRPEVVVVVHPDGVAEQSWVGFAEVFIEIAGADGLGRGLGGESLAEVGELEELGQGVKLSAEVRGAVGIDGPGGIGEGLEKPGGVGGGAGELEVGLEAEGVTEFFEGLSEGRATEPAAHEVGVGHGVGGQAGGALGKLAQKNSLGAGGTSDVRHK